MGSLKPGFEDPLASGWTSQTAYTADPVPSIPQSGVDLYPLAVGETTVPRALVSSQSLAVTSGVLYLTYFTARVTETINFLELYTGTVAAGATPTLVRGGIYTPDTTGNLTLTSAIANDTSVFAAATTAYKRALTTPFAKVAGKTYAYGFLVVTAAATPTMVATQIYPAALASVSPRMSAAITAQTDLPASLASGVLGTPSANRLFLASLLP